MTTIHIHLGDDHSTALGMVAAFLNQGYRVTIDLDEMVPATKRAQADPLRRPFVDARAVKARTDALKPKRDQVKAWKRDEDAIEAMSDASKQLVYDARYAEAQAARIVECKACGAKVDHPCTTPSGKPYGAFVHIDRVMDANTARGSHVQ